MLQERVPGANVADAVGAKPWCAHRFASDLGALQARLHAVPVDGSPLTEDGPASRVFLEHDLRRRRRNVAADDVDGRLVWLEATADRFRDREVVLCHGDFHPLNVLVDRVGRHPAYSVVDWTDAARADPHSDVGRSLALYWFAGVAVGSATQRRLVGAIAPALRRWHRRAYERASGRTLDDRLLAWWEAVHVLRGWLQLQETSEGAVVGPDSDAVAALPEDLQDRLLARFDALRTSLDAV
jgi:aminoglycoside phosphotransferase (APT) family kinase protein